MFSRQNSGHVLPDDPFRINFCASSEIFEHELAARIVQSLPESGDGEGLAGTSSHNDICCMVVFLPVNFGHVPKVGNVRKMVFQYGFGERFDFGVCDWLPSECLPGYRCGFDAAEKADVFHDAASSRFSSFAVLTAKSMSFTSSLFFNFNAFNVCSHAHVCLWCLAGGIPLMVARR